MKPNLFGFLSTKGKPYSWYKPEGDNIIMGLGHRFVNWIVLSIYGEFSNYRAVIRWWLSLFSKANETFLTNDMFQMLFVAPATLLFSPFIIIIAFCATFWYATMSNFAGNFPWNIIGLFGPTWMLASSISIVQFIKYLSFFLFLPLIINLNKVKEILKCNSKFLIGIFGLLVCVQAFESLNNITAITMISVYAISYIASFFF